MEKHKLEMEQKNAEMNKLKAELADKNVNDEEKDELKKELDTIKTELENTKAQKQSSDEQNAGMEKQKLEMDKLEAKLAKLEEEKRQSNQKLQDRINEMEEEARYIQETKGSVEAAKTVSEESVKITIAQLDENKENDSKENEKAAIITTASETDGSGSNSQQEDEELRQKIEESPSRKKQVAMYEGVKNKLESLLEPKGAQESLEDYGDEVFKRTGGDPTFGYNGLLYNQQASSILNHMTRHKYESKIDDVNDDLESVTNIADFAPKSEDYLKDKFKSFLRQKLQTGAGSVRSGTSKIGDLDTDKIGGGITLNSVSENMLVPNKEFDDGFTHINVPPNQAKENPNPPGSTDLIREGTQLMYSRSPVPLQNNEVE
jgi:multidrug efflux pump subunit AcrA (membrane-fusion protein)